MSPDGSWTFWILLDMLEGNYWGFFVKGHDVESKKTVHNFMKYLKIGVMQNGQQ